MKFYCGIGSRKAPDEICELMTQIAKKLSSQNWILRSGLAQGADQAFEAGADKAEIWLPWTSFNFSARIPSHEYKVIQETPEVIKSLDFHWDKSKLSRGSRLLMMRNFRQVISEDGNNSKFVMCWTDDEQRSGSAQAIKIARHYGIPVYNFWFPEMLERAYRFLEK